MALLSILLALSLAPLPTGGPWAQDRDSAIVTTTRFELKSDPRIALHHLLIDWASADAGQWPPFALRLTAREEWHSVLGADEQRVWAGAVEAYGATVGRNLLFDQGLLATRDWAVGVGTRDAIPAPRATGAITCCGIRGVLPAVAAAGDSRTKHGAAGRCSPPASSCV